MKTPEDVTTAARAYVGTPFHLHGRRKGVGIDCLGIAMGVCREMGHDVPEYKNYTHTLSDNIETKVFEQALGLQRVPDPAQQIEGTILTFHVARHIHVAICTGDTMIHAIDHPGLKKVVEIAMCEKWRSRLRTAWFIPTVSY